MNEIVIAY